MEYICLECGLLVDESAVKHWTEDYGEEMSGCPDCYGALVEPEYCTVCGAPVIPDSLYEGVMCEHCLREAVEYDNAYAYLVDGTKSHTDSGYLEEFMFIEIFNLADCVPKYSSAELKQVLTDIFVKRTQQDRMWNKTDFLDRLKRYIMWDYGDDASVRREEWAEFLKEYVSEALANRKEVK